MKQVSVLIGAGSIGQAIIRRVSAGKHIVLADYSFEHAEQAAKTLGNAGFECSTIKCDLGSKEDIQMLVEFAMSKGDVTNVVNAAGVLTRSVAGQVTSSSGKSIHSHVWVLTPRSADDSRRML